MKKRIAVFLVCVVLSLMGSARIGIAADMLHMMLHADEYEEFGRYQDTFIVGQITDNEEQIYPSLIAENSTGPSAEVNIKHVEPTSTSGALLLERYGLVAAVVFGALIAWIWRSANHKKN